MFVTSIIVMVVGLLGLIVCAGNKKNPAMQPIAVGCLLVTLVGFGLYMYDSNFKDKNKANMETYALRELAAYHKVGSVLKEKVSGKKVLVLVDGMTSETLQEKFIEALKNSFGGEVIIEKMQAGEDGNIDSLSYRKDYKPIFARYKDAGAIVFTIQLPFDMKYSELKAPLVLFQNGDFRARQMKAMLNNNKLLAVRTYKSYSATNMPEPDEENLDKTFDMFFNLVTKENFDQFAKDFQ